MTRSVLVGKGRRVTLDELECVCVQDGVLEIHAGEDITDMSIDDEAAISAAISSLSLNDDNSSASESASLSAADTRAVLVLLANFIAQSRIMPSTTCLNMSTTAAIAHIVNSKSNLQLPASSSQAFLDKLAELMPANIQEHLQEEQMTTYLPLALSRIIPLALTALATVHTSRLTNTTVIDALASLSVERNAIDPAVFHDSLYDVNRPHRGMITSASVVRVCTQGSKYATKQPLKNITVEDDTRAALESIPAYHGPAADVITTSLKVLELEFNCFESLDLSDKKSKPKFVALVPQVVGLACQSVGNAVMLLLQGCKSRMGEAADADAASGSSTSTSTEDIVVQAMGLSKNVSALYEALTKEANGNCEFIQSEVSAAAEDAKQKAAEKAARAAVRDGEVGGDAAGGKDEFDGMTEAQKAKVLKKRAEKEAKAAKKRAAKREITGDSGVSIFGAGSMVIVNAISTSNGDFLSSDNIGKMEEAIGNLLSGGVQRKPKIAKGTRDYLPDQMMIRDQAFQIIRRVFKAHGAVEIDTPVFELKDTLTGKYGEDSKLIYDLADQGGELLALRYDLTVPFARFLALNSVGNIKRFHIGKVYRRDQPQLSKGRYREFYQCDFDIAGTYGRMVPDSECLCVASEILSSLPIGDFGIKLNHRRLLDAILDLSGVPADKFRTICSAVDKLDKEPWSEVKREMVEDKGLAPDVADKIGVFVVQKGEPWEMLKSLTANAVFGQHKGALDALEDLRILFQYLEAMGKLQYFSFDLSLARGLDYYTGVIYEAVCMNGNTQVGSIGGGGRYDNLVSMFQEAGKITPCVGVSVGIERVFTLMEERLRQQQGGSIKQPNVNVLVAQAGENMIVERMKITKLLWDANISAEFNQQENPKLKYEIVNALDRNIPFVVVIGEDEAREKKVKIKDLNAKTEETVDQSNLAAALRSKGVIPVGCEFAAEILAAEKVNK